VEEEVGVVMEMEMEREREREEEVPWRCLEWGGGGRGRKKARRGGEGGCRRRRCVCRIRRKMWMSQWREGVSKRWCEGGERGTHTPWAAGEAAGGAAGEVGNKRRRR
jgi:hypothetical protein